MVPLVHITEKALKMYNSVPLYASCTELGHIPNNSILPIYVPYMEHVK